MQEVPTDDDPFGATEETYVAFPPAPDMSPEERGDDNDGWWEHVIETAGMVSPDVEDEPPPADADDAPLMVNDVSDEPVVVDDNDDDVRF